jgi:hypothetical protein
MDHIGVVKRAFHITWHYKLLWVFGVVLALTSGGGAGGGGNSQVTPPGGMGNADVFQDLETLPQLPFSGENLIPLAVGVGIVLLLGLLLLGLISVVARYVSLASVIRLGDDYEETGEKRTLGEGVGMGWTRRTWRLFLVQLLISLPVAILGFVMVLVSLAPLLLWIADENWLGAVGTVATVCMLVPTVFILIALGVATKILARFSERACALGDLGVIASVKHGYATIRANFKDVALMWLLMVGAGILWALVSLFAFGLLAMVGLALGGIPAVAVGLLASLATEGAVPWVLGGLVGLPVCVLVVFLPMLLLQGVYQVFQANVWTLTYRALRGEAHSVAS